MIARCVAVTKKDHVGFICDTDLHDRLHKGSYRALSSRRARNAKEDGSERKLGIAALEDKIVQQAVATVLEAIYEADFVAFSYGFRPGRDQYQALDALYMGLTERPVEWAFNTRAKPRHFLQT